MVQWVGRSPMALEASPSWPPSAMVTCLSRVLKFCRLPKTAWDVHSDRIDTLWSSLTALETTTSAWRTENLLSKVFSIALDFLMNLAIVLMGMLSKN